MTSKAGHTAGPWRAERTRDGDYRIVYNNAGNWLAEVHADGEPEAAKADASLIAAAPDMLDALKGAEEWLSGWASAEPFLTTIRAALAKATAGGAL